MTEFTLDETPKGRDPRQISMSQNEVCKILKELYDTPQGLYGSLRMDRLTYAEMEVFACRTIADQLENPDIRYWQAMTNTIIRTLEAFPLGGPASE